MKCVSQGLLVLSLLLLMPVAQADDDSGGYAFQLDNDLFSTAHRDQDYSWGAAFTYASPHPGKLLRPLHSVRDKLDAWLVPDESESGGWAPAQQATQMGILAMTPRTLRSA